MFRNQFIKTTKQFSQLKQSGQLCQISTKTPKSTKLVNEGNKKQPKQTEQTERKLDQNSINWILTVLNKDQLKLSNSQIADLHGHSGGSWYWTNQQVKIIKDKGFNEWFYKTDGPLGYGVAFGQKIKNIK
jgi:hypothetical protein